MKPTVFIASALELVQTDTRGRPRETDLRRAVSTTYYALFHAIAICCANTLVGGSSSNRSESAWIQVYRAVEHRTARVRCENQQVMQRFPAEIQGFARLFVELQIARHEADYNPNPEFEFYKSAVLQNIVDPEYQLDRFSAAPIRDRRAFAVHVLMPVRRS